MQAYYKYHLFFCTNQRETRDCCQQFDAIAFRDYMKSEVKRRGLTGIGGVRVNTAGCLDRCAEGPVMVIYPEAIWYTYIDKADLDEIIEQHLINGKPVQRLMLKNPALD